MLFVAFCPLFLAKKEKKSIEAFFTTDNWRLTTDMPVGLILK